MFKSGDKLVVVSLIIISVSSDHMPSVIYPDNMENATTCEEFSQFARFNPYSVMEYHWFVFYYWGPDMPRTEYRFHYPNPKQKAMLHYILDEYVSVPINWTARYVVMTNAVNNHSSLIVETGDRGQFLRYPFYKTTKKNPKITPFDVRFKQTGDNKYIAYMSCNKKTVYVMSKKSDIPPKKRIQDEAARIGYRGRGAKSYLYQGHSWMPIPEEDEENYWMGPEEQQKEKDKLEMMRRYAKPKKK